MSSSLVQHPEFHSPFLVLVLMLSIGPAHEADMKPYEHDKDKCGENEVMVLYDHDHRSFNADFADK